MKNKKLIYFIVVLIIVLDQLIKVIMINKNIKLIPNILSIKYAENTGGAFSILSNNIVLILCLSAIIIALLFEFLKKRREQLDLKQIIALCMILAGGGSNLIDRIVRGYVIDYIKVNLFNFPTFNIADICIVIGIVLIGLDIIFKILIKNK